MTDNIKIFTDNDTNTLRINDNINLKSDFGRVVQSNDLKNTQTNTNRGYMSPKLNEEIHRPEMNSNLKILEDDINLLANKKKTKNFSSSSEEDISSEENSDISTEDGESDNEFAKDTNNFIGRADDDLSETSGGNDDTYTESTSSEGGDDTITSTSHSMRVPPPRQKTLEEINQEKQELLYRLERLDQSGFKPSRKYTMQSNLEDIKGEYERLKKQRDVDKSIKFQRKILMAVTSGIEFLNGKFDPLNVKLDGWSESIYENLHEYDEVFEELHEKYKEKVKVAPEVKLLMMVGGSAFMFHMTNTLFKSKMPGLGDILQQNPELVRNVQQAAMNTMRQNEEKTGNQDPLFSMMMNQAQNMMGPKPARPAGAMGPGVKEMRGPSGVDDILSMVNGPKPMQQKRDEDTISSVSSQESLSKKKIKVRRPATGAQKNSNGKFVLDLQ